MEPRHHPSGIRVVSIVRGKGLLCALLLPPLLMAGCALEEPVDPPASSPPSPAAPGVLRLMDTPQEDADRFPTVGPDLMTEMRPETTRSLDSDAELMTTTCGDAEGFLDSGLSSRTKAPSEEDGRLRSEAYLLPDDVDAEPLNDHLAEYLVPLEAPEGLTADRAVLQEEVNFFSVGPGAYGLPDIDLERASGEPYTFRTLG